jgi:hypothetical protein
MSIDNLLTTTDAIDNLKKDLVKIWMKYNETLSLEQLVYLDRVYGIMQRQELELLLEELDNVKEHVNWLYDECLFN